MTINFSTKIGDARSPPRPAIRLLPAGSGGPTRPAGQRAVAAVRDERKNRFACVSSAGMKTQDWLGLPFDVLRAQYACAVQGGLIQHSLLASSAFERALVRLEHLLLGVWARSV